MENIHVFFWTHEPHCIRHPLVKAKADWLQYLQMAAEAKGDKHALLEFVKNDKLEQLINDARTSNNILAKVNIKRGDENE